MVQLETEKDRENQRLVAKMIAQRYRCGFKETEPFHSLDFHFFRNGRMIGVAEIKCREIKVSTYETLYLTLRKREALFEYHQRGIPAIYVIGFMEEPLLTVGWVDVMDTMSYEPERKKKGRYDRDNDPWVPPHDREYMVEVPREKFVILR